MSHLLAKLKNVKLEVIREILERDTVFHIENGMYLEQLWQNVDDDNEVLFLFKINNIDTTKILIDQLHSQALRQNPEANLPEMTFLK